MNMKLIYNMLASVDIIKMLVSMHLRVQLIHFVIGFVKFVQSEKCDTKGKQKRMKTVVKSDSKK